MQTPIKLAGFAVGLMAVFGGAVGLGSLVGPVGGADSTPAHDRGHMATGTNDNKAGAGDSREADHSEMPGMGADSGPGTTPAELPAAGLMVSQDHYTLQLVDPEVAPDPQSPMRFRILGPDGTPVTDYTRTHGKGLHLIVVRRDMAGFQHVHPTLDADGTWSTALDLTRAGEYRVFADFDPAGADESLTLGTDLSVAGDYDPQPLPGPTRTARVDDYTVTLEGELVPGEDSKLTMSLSRNGRPVTDLQPYLEAYGHLVALRDGDLAYLHVHPAGSLDDDSTKPGPEITFFASVPSSGDYRLFLDFRHRDQVHTAAFTARAEDATAGSVQKGHGSGEPSHRH